MPRPPRPVYGSDEFNRRYRSAVYPNRDQYRGMPDLEDNPDYVEDRLVGYDPYANMPDLEDNLDDFETQVALPAQRDYQITPEVADWLTLGRQVGNAIANQDSTQYIRDKETGRYLVRKKRGDPNDPNYFWNPYNRMTTERVKDTAVNRFLYDHGITSRQYGVEPAPLTVMPAAVRDFNYERNTEEALRRNRDRVAREDEEEVVRPPPRPPMVQRVVNGDLAPPKGGMHHSNIARPVNQESQGVLKLSSSEFICNIAANANVFSVLKFSINPGLYSTFPVLSQIASCFVFYKFTKLKFVYISTSSDSLDLSASTGNLSLGSICISHLENSASASPTTFGQIMNFPGAKSFRPSLSKVEYEIDCTQFLCDSYFCRVNPTVVDGQIQLTDCSNFFISTNGFQTAYTCGELHVEYEISLWDVFLNGTLRGNQNLYYRCKFGSPNVAPENGIAPDGPIDGHGNMGCYIDSGNSGEFFRLRFPSYVTSGIFHVTIVLSANATFPSWGHNGANGPSQPNVPLDVLGNPGVTFLGMDFVSPVCSSAWQGASGSAVPVNDVRSIYTTSNTTAQGPYTFYMPSYSATDWTMGITISFYVEINFPLRVGSAQGDYGAQMTVSQADSSIGNLYEGSLSVEQVNPNYHYAWSAGGGVDTP